MTSLGEPGGVGYVGRLIDRALAGALGHRPHVVSLSRGSGIPVGLGDRLQYWARLLAAQATGRADWAFYTHVGVARSQNWLPGPLARPYGVFVHGIEVWPPDLDAGRKAALRGARVRISNSRYTARRVMETHPDVGAVSPCPLALLPEDGAPAGELDRELLARVDPAASVLIAGRLSAAERYKGHDELLEAWPAVRSRVPRAQLVVSGSGDDLARLRAKAAELGVGDAVLFGGWVSDATLAALFSRVAAYAMPSRGEGFGLVYLEAMRAGLPCIGSTDDAAGDVIVAGETGLLVQQRDREALTRALVTLLTEEPLRRRLGEAGRQRYELEFTFASFERRLIDLWAGAFGARTG